MSYVYRYTDLSDNVIKYVGIVCREGEDALSRRIEEHSYNDSWCFNKTWKIEYIKVPTKNDANSLESHFIAKWETHKWFNIKKKHDGLLPDEKVVVLQGVCGYMSKDINEIHLCSKCTRAFKKFMRRKIDE